MGDSSDQTLVAQTLNGDSEAFGQLAERHYRTLWVLAYQKTGNRSDAEDVVQEALVRAFRSLSSLRDHTKFASWAYNITFKLCIDWLRRRNRRDSTVSFEEKQLTPNESGRYARISAVGEELEAAEEHAQVLEVLGDLPDKYRLVITLRYVKRLSYREIAEHLDEPAGTIANRLHRATRLLQERLTAKAAQEEGR